MAPRGCKPFALFSDDARTLRGGVQGPGPRRLALLLQRGVRVRSWVLLAMVVMVPQVARAAACCVSATAFGVGRLLAWEDAAVGVQLGHVRVLGQYDGRGALRLFAPGAFSDGLSRLEPWGIVRVGERLQLQARLPLVLNDRSALGQHELAFGLGDLGAAARIELIGLGEYESVPSLGLTVGALAPTGRRPEQTWGPLGAGATGRGAWAGSLALESEYTWLPWYLRFDVGVTVFAPFSRSDTGARQWFGPLVQLALSGGRELVPDKLVLAVSGQLEWEAPMTLDAEVQPSTRALLPTVLTSLSWRVHPRWTFVTSLSASVWPSGLAQNRDARVGLVLGGRHGVF